MIQEARCPSRYISVFTIFIFLILFAGGTAEAKDVSLSEALDIAVNRSSRGEIIRGDLEVAQQNYFAQRISFYIPQVSLNGSLPAYNVNESFRFFGGLDQKQLIRTTDLEFTGNIQLTQNLLTGGNFSATGNIWNNESRYPLAGIDVTETSRQGIFNFKFQQPLFKPSEPKNQLKNRKDDLELARLTRIEDQASLQKEVTETYFGVLQTSLQMDITQSKVEKARLDGDIDSVKFVEGVIAEDKWLESASARLDAELEQFDMDNQQAEKNRELALLLDFDVTESITPQLPILAGHYSEREKKLFIDNWEESCPVEKARYAYSKAQREASFTAASHGLTGTVDASYSIGRGSVEVDTYTTDNNTDSWQVSVNLSLPLWDGGSTGASIKAARLTAQKSEMEYLRIRKSTRAEIVNLINGLDVSYRKLQVLEKQIELAKNKLDIAKFRFDDGQISRQSYLENKIFYLEAQNKYLEELKKYFTGKIDLESKYRS